jgi:hypothetical protein
MTPLANEFSWSHSRHECFQTCLRRYYYAYYGGWGGWESDAPPQVRLLYCLKRLSTRQQWAGLHAHQAIEFLLKHARHESDGAVSANAEPRQIELMRREFRDSRAGAYRQNPTRTLALFEHEYGVDVPPDEWKATVDRVSLAIRQFLASELLKELKALPDDAFLAVERRSHFMLDGLKVYAVPDLVVRADGLLRIYDWKTGDTPLEQHRIQLGIYALFAAGQWATPPAQIRAIAYNSGVDRLQPFTYSADDLETLREFVRDSADEMLFPLANPQANDPGDGSAFDCTEDPEPCASCPFLRVCPRWQK